MTNTTNDTTPQGQLDRLDAGSPDFDWLDDVEDVIFPTTEAVAIYVSEDGNIVIRQQAPWYDDEDDVIVIPASHATKVARAITDCLEQLEDVPPPKSNAPRKPTPTGPAQAERPPTRDRTAADRMRRYRDRKRNAPEDDRNGDRNQDRNSHRNAAPLQPELLSS